MRKYQISGEQKDVKILTLDDDVSIGAALQSYFRVSGYHVDVETDPFRAIERIRKEHYDILLLDFLMTPICGDKVVEEIRKFNTSLFIILLTGHKSMAPPIKTIRELNIQGYYEKSDRFDQLELLVESCVKSIGQINLIRAYKTDLEAVNGSLVEANRKLQSDYDEIVKIMRSTVDARDIYTRGHSDRVAILAERISAAMNRDPEATKRIKTTGLFHDIGKLKIPDQILLKEGALTPEDRTVIQQHPLYAIEIVSNSDKFTDMLPGILQHHERFDGSGYPNRLPGNKICEDARIISVADSFDAMTSFRRYRVNMTVEQARAEILSKSGTQFDPAVVKIFVKLLDGFDKIESEAEWAATYGDRPKK
ncbi:MAG: HD domain-containing protein [Firmicutes bacterium]|nr:HD domain-containing protein [Bacillota bacterium]